MATSTSPSSNSIGIEGSQQYPYPSHVNAASFLSIKLSGKSNYRRWRTQMLCLVDSHDMRGFIDGTIKEPEENNGSKMEADMAAFKTKYNEWKRSDSLVKGWIFGSLSEDAMDTVDYLETAKMVWDMLKIIYRDGFNRITSTDEYDKYIPLCTAIERGDWETAEKTFTRDRKALTSQIDENGNTALQMAIRANKNFQFLENILHLIYLHRDSVPDLAKELRYAIIYGNKVAVEKFLHKDRRFLFVAQEDKLPLVTAARYSQRTIFDYLIAECKANIGLSLEDGYLNPFKGDPVLLLLTYTVEAGYYDVAYDLLKDYYPELSWAMKYYHESTLRVLARSVDAFSSSRGYNFYKRFVYSHLPVEDYNLVNIMKKADIENQETNKTNHVTWKSYVYPVTKKIYVKFWKALRQVPHIKHLHKEKVSDHKVLMLVKFLCENHNISLARTLETQTYALILAVENDIPEVIEQITHVFPQLIHTKDDDNHTLYELSLMNRCENAYNLLVHKMAPHKKFPINFMGLLEKLPPSYKLNMITGAALQMQRELQWIKEVDILVTTKEERESWGTKYTIPIMEFSKELEDLRQKGEEWMKNTANSYTITAALIITIVFAAAITVPGGNNGDTGKAIYKTQPSFIIFIVSDAISLFTATTSLLLFLSILTARYSFNDFLYKLPKRLILGLVMLFMSVTTMLIAFGASLYIISGQENLFILIPIIALTCLPVASFVTLQLPLLVDLIYSTYGSPIAGKGSMLRKTL